MAETIIAGIAALLVFLGLLGAFVKYNAAKFDDADDRLNDATQKRDTQFTALQGLVDMRHAAAIKEVNDLRNHIVETYAKARDLERAEAAFTNEMKSLSDGTYTRLDTMNTRLDDLFLAVVKAKADVEAGAAGRPGRKSPRSK